PVDAATALDRLAGYRLGRADGNASHDLFVHAPFSQDGGAIAVAELLDLTPPPDSFLVGNAQMALGVIGELKRRGIRIGRDVGIVTFDDAPWAPFIDPPISVVAQPAYEIGATAASLLLDRITGHESGAPREIVLSAELLVRESSRSPARRAN
ncbi:MAG: substrate-binding domain-containing protein, partial [Rhodoglobus sp.]|nr:substrate-binding domain-containing protein [Rhodoglobus sp.]